MSKISRLLPVLLFAFSIFCPAAPRAMETGMEEILFSDLPNVITASRKAESINDAPNTMYVFTAQEIRQRGFRKLEDLISIVPGMGVFHRDLQLVAQVRGVAPNENEKIAWMVDGHIINNVVQPEVMSGPINFDAVERVEVIVGPGSVLYGPDTLLAIVNLITKKVEGHEVTVSAGDRGLGSNSATLAMGQKWGDTRTVSISGTYVTKEGFGGEEAGTVPRPADTNYQANYARLYPSFYINGRGQFDDWTLQAISLNTDLAHLNAKQDSGVDRRRYEHVDSLILNKDDHWTDNLLGTLRFSYDSKRESWRTVKYPKGASAGSLAVADPYDYDMADFVYNLEYSLQHRTEKNFLQGGIQYSHKQHRNNDISLFNPSTNDTSLPPADPNEFINELVKQSNTNVLGAYISEEFQATDKLKFVAALRGDRDSILGERRNRIYTSPRFAAILNATDAWTTKLMYNTATHMPQSWESPLNKLWGSNQPVPFQGFGSFNRLAEKPETLQAIEWQNILQGSKTRLAATVFYQKLNDYITWFDPWTNGGDFEGKGVDADVTYKLSSSVKLRAGGNYVKTLIRHSLPPNPQTPHHAVNDKGEMLAAPQVSANAGVDWSVTKHLFFSTTVRYFTRQPLGFQVPGFTASTDPVYYKYVYNRSYVDAALTWDGIKVLGKEASLQVAGRNLTDDRRYVSAPQQRQSYLPRGVEGSVAATVKF